MVGQVSSDAGSGRPKDGAVAPTPADTDSGTGAVATARREAPGSTVLAGSPLAKLYGVSATKVPERAGKAPEDAGKAPEDAEEWPEVTGEWPEVTGEATASVIEKAPELTDAPPTPPRPPLLRPPEAPRPPQVPLLVPAPGGAAPTTTAGGVTATVSALAPKGVRARVRAMKPRNLAIIASVAAAVVVAIAVVTVLLVMRGTEDERPAEFAFDSDAIHSITDGMSSTVAPADPSSGDDPTSLWNYDTAPTPGGMPSPGTGKYTPPYRGGGSSNFIPYTPPSGSAAGPSGTGGGGDASTRSVAAVMPAGSYGFAGSGTLLAAFWGKTVAVPPSVSASVTTDGGCSTLGIGAGGVTLASAYCLSGGTVTAGERSRALQNGRLTLACPGPLVPAGAAGGQSFDVTCTAASGTLSEQMAGHVSLADSGSAWVATTSVRASNGDTWSENVTIDKASGNVIALRSTVKIAFPAYQESTAFTLQ